MVVKESLGARMKAARLAAGFKRVAVFAPRVGVREPTIYRIESGTNPPSLATFMAWAEVCGVSLDDLARGKRPKTEAA